MEPQKTPDGAGTVIFVGLLWITCWIGLLLFASRIASRIPGLPPFVEDSLDELGDLVSVIVPARNEEKAVERGVRSILAQSYGNIEVIVVDDHSTDKTASILDKIADEDPRVSILHSPPLRDGWLGKPSAQSHGTDAARGEWLVFVDADIILHEHTISRAVQTAQARGLAGLTFIPKFIAMSWAESGMVPLLPLAIAALRPDTANTPHGGGGFAAGAFILVSRDAYGTVGGHSCVKTEVIDDIAFGKAMKRAKLPFRAFEGFDAAEVRMYYGPKSLLYGLTKNISFLFGGAKGRPWLAVFNALFFCSALSVPLGLVVTGSLAGEVAVALVGLTGYMIPIASVLTAGASLEYNARYLVFYPVAAWLIFFATLVAAYYMITRRTVLWRDREVRLAG